MGHFGSSIALDAVADEVFAFLNDDAHLRAFVVTVEPDETFRDPRGDASDGSWFHVGPGHRRLDWHGSHSHGYVWVIHRGDSADLVADVHTRIDREGLDTRLDTALFQVQEQIDALQATPAGVPHPEDSPSFVVETVLKGLRRHLPVELRPELSPYLERAVSLDGNVAVEAERGAICRAWSDNVAAVGHQGLGRRVIGFIEHVRHAFTSVDESLVAAEGASLREAESDAEHLGHPLVQQAAVAAIDPEGVPDGFRQELDESYEAVSAAADAAAHSGWDSVPWKALLDSLFAA